MRQALWFTAKQYYIHFRCHLIGHDYSTKLRSSIGNFCQLKNVCIIFAYRSDLPPRAWTIVKEFCSRFWLASLTYDLEIVQSLSGSANCVCVTEPVCGRGASHGPPPLPHACLARRGLPPGHQHQPAPWGRLPWQRNGRQPMPSGAAAHWWVSMSGMSSQSRWYFVVNISQKIMHSNALAPLHYLLKRRGRGICSVLRSHFWQRELRRRH